MKAGAGSGGGGSIPSEGGRRWPSRQLARDKKIALLLTERYEARGGVGRAGGWAPIDAKLRRRVSVRATDGWAGS